MAEPEKKAEGNGTDTSARRTERKLSREPSVPYEHEVNRPHWMELPEVPENDTSCPPGLEYLMKIDTLLVHEEIDLLEEFTGWEKANKYVIKNGQGQQVYYAAEVSACCERQWCGPARSFKMSILDNSGREVMCMHRPYRCTVSCCCESCRPFMEIQAPPGNTIGYVKSDGWACVKPKFLVMDASQTPVLRIHTPYGGDGCCRCRGTYPVRTLDGQDVGHVKKHWSGLAKEFFTDLDNFGIDFPVDLDVKIKGVVMGALFLIDFLFFEKSGGSAEP